MNNQVHTQIVSFIWSIADDCLRDVYVRGKYRDVILPMTVIRRLDAMLEGTIENVRNTKKLLDEAKVDNQWPALCNAAGQPFCNASPFLLKDLTSRASKQKLKTDFETYLDGFSPNVQEILEKFKFRNQIATMVDADILGSVIEKFVSSDINLSPNPVYKDDEKTILKHPGLDNHGMGTIFEELIRKFNEENNEEAGEHWTPRDVVELMADLIFIPIADQINGLKTDYLWKEILTKDKLTRIIESYAQVVTEVDEETKKKTVKQIFPRYHQLDVVEKLIADVEANGVGNRYLIQHSAGSGKSNSIAWLAYRLMELEKDAHPIFNSILVVTDRRILDKQIRDNIKQFAQVGNVVAWAEHSGDLRKAITDGKRIIITTIEKFPYVVPDIGAEHKDNKFAILIDEAHSGQNGRNSAQMNLALSGLASDNDMDNEDKINAMMEGRKLLKNTVFKSIESLGGSINSDLSVKIRDDIVRFRMVESQDQVKHEMTKQEAQELVKYNDDIKNHRWASKPQIRKYDKVYNGKLRIEFGERSYIRDKDSEKLEDRLGDILVTLYEKAEENRIVREAREEAERKRVEEARCREENRQRKEQEIRLVKELVNKAEDYRIAKEIREYIQAMIDSGNEDITPEWIEWALKKADWYDPSIETEDEYLGKRQHEKSAEEKEKSLQDSIRKSWYW